MAPRQPRPFLLLLLVATFAISFAACGGGDDTSNATVGRKRLATRSAGVGSVDVRASPLQVSDRAAAFKISLDTHSGDLGIDLKKAATLTVNGTDWPIASFDGDGPGGHHREGTLSFRAAGAPQGEMRLRIEGLDRPAEFTWSLGR
jgi:hypothetical protein